MDAAAIQIRPYQPGDLPVLKAITVEAFEPVSIDRNIEQQFGPIQGHDWRWRKARHIEEDIHRQATGVFVAEAEGQIVGYITTFSDAEAGIGYILNLAVHRDWRGAGIGRQLILFALDHFRGQQLTHARIETLDQNAVGQKLYPSLGFQEVARQIHYCRRLD